MTKPQRKLFWIGFALSFAVGLTLFGADAQQPASPTEQALGKRLMAEISAGLACDSGLITAQAQVADLTRQIADLKNQLAAAKGDSPPK